jgi:hypothetical protein
MARFPFPALSLSLALLAAGPAAALDWPQFRGVNRDGVSAETSEACLDSKGPSSSVLAVISTGASQVPSDCSRPRRPR